MVSYNEYLYCFFIQQCESSRTERQKSDGKDYLFYHSSIAAGGSGHLYVCRYECEMGVLEFRNRKLCNVLVKVSVSDGFYNISYE